MPRRNPLQHSLQDLRRSLTGIARAAGSPRGGKVQVTRRRNVVIVRNACGRASASAEQYAPIDQRDSRQ